MHPSTASTRPQVLFEADNPACPPDVVFCGVQKATAVQSGSNDRQQRQNRFRTTRGRTAAAAQAAAMAAQAATTAAKDAARVLLAGRRQALETAVGLDDLPTLRDADWLVPAGAAEGKVRGCHSVSALRR